MMKKLCAGCIVFSLLSSLAYAQDVTVVTEEMKPYNYTEDGQVIGMSTEVVRATLERAGIDAEIGIFPWPRAYKMATENPNTLIFSIGRNPERKALFKWIGPIAPPIKSSLFKLKQRDDVVVNSIEDAKAYQVGVPRGSASHQFFLRQGFEDEKNLDAVMTSEQNIKKLFLERIDLFVSSEWGLEERVEAAGFSFDDIEPVLVLNEVQLYMAFSQNTPDDMYQKVNAAFEELKAEGFLEQVDAKYRKLVQ